MFLRVGDGHELGEHQQQMLKLKRQRESLRDSENDPDKKSLLPGNLKGNFLINHLTKEMEKKVLDEYSVTDHHEGGCF